MITCCLNGYNGKAATGTSVIKRRTGKLWALSRRKRETWSPSDFFASVFTGKSSATQPNPQKAGTGRMKNCPCRRPGLRPDKEPKGARVHGACRDTSTGPVRSCVSPVKFPLTGRNITPFFCKGKNGDAGNYSPVTCTPHTEKHPHGKPDLPSGCKYPPYISSSIPFLGHAIAFGKSPIEFLENAYDKYGPVFSFTMVGKTFTYLLGSDAAALLFNSKNEDLNAEDVYSRLTTPVFGKGVAYDVPNAVFLEQKKMLKTGLNIAQFKQHVSVIEEETKEYFKAWGESGEKNLFEALSELIILTASHCLHGKEIRSLLNEKVAQLYADLDGGFTHAAWLLPGWLPLPSFRRRDRAHREIKNIFYKVIQKRRNSEEKEDDMLQTLLDASYKDGRPLTDDEIAGMLIGLLLAGQHTSSTTSAWLGFFIARDKSIQEQCYAEQKAVCGDDLPPLTYDQLKDLSLLDRCLKETLRLRPPIMTMMRMAKTPQTVAGYSIPPGHQVCVSPTVNHRLRDSWKDALDFKPDRYLQDNPAAGEKFAYVPFGAGRHRCIGENFAYVQIKTIWSTLLRLYEFDLINDYFPTINYTTMIHTPNNPIIRYKRRSL